MIKDKTIKKLDNRKPTCFCGTPFGDMSWKRYKMQGNICSACNVRAEKVIKRELTFEEADAELAEVMLKNKVAINK